MKLKEGKPIKDIVSADGKVTVPEGFIWCNGCNGLTQHIDTKHSWSKACIICGDTHHESDYHCPNCGYDNEDNEEISPYYIAIAHHEGCHCDEREDREEWDSYFGTWARKIARSFEGDWMMGYPDRMIWSYRIGDDVHKEYERREKRRAQWRNAFNVECGCPRHIVYTNLNIFNYQGGYVYSQDCMNAMEWSYDVRCKMCGEVYSIYDSNC